MKAWALKATAGKAIVLIAIARGACAFAQVVQIEIPAEDAGKSIPELARQASVQIVGPGEVLHGVVTPEVKGSFDVIDALKMMLKTTDLKVSRSVDGVIVISSSDKKNVCSDEGETIMNQSKLKMTVSWIAMAVATLQCAMAQGSTPNTADTMETVVVQGLRASLGQAREIKRDADTIVDSIVAVDVGKFPDNNVVESLARIPGIQITRKASEGQDIRIRGLKEQKAVLNGREVLTGGGGGGWSGRNLNLGDLSSDVIGAIDVYKASTSDQIEGGLGGYINVRTHRPFDFDGLKVTGSVKGEYFDRIRNLGGTGALDYSALVSDRWQTKWGEVGLLFNISHTKVAHAQDRQGAEEYGDVANYAGSGKTVSIPTFYFMNGTLYGDHTRDSMIGIFEWKPSSELKFYAEYYGWESSFKDQFADLRVDLRNPTPTTTYTLFSGTQDLQSGDFANVALEQTTTVQPTTNVSRMYVLGGEWNHNDLSLKAELTRTDATNTGDLFEWQMNGTAPLATVSRTIKGDFGLDTHGFNTANPANYSPFDFLAIVGGGHIKDMVASFSGEYKIGLGILDKIEGGFRFGQYGAGSRSDNMSSWSCCFSPVATAAGMPANLLQVFPSDAGNFVAFNMAEVWKQSDLRTYFGRPAQAIGDKSKYLDGVENTYAGYGKLSYAVPLPADMILDGNVGVRYIETNLHTTAYGTNPADPTGATIQQTTASERGDWLPSANARVKVTDDIVLRAAVSRTMQRITIDELNGSVTVTNAAQKQATRGNPNMQPVLSWNYDMSLEYYFSATGLFYAAGFQKQVQGYAASYLLENQTIPGWTGNDWRISTYENLSSSKILGFELGVQSFFDFLPEPFDGLGAQANYTYIDSKTQDPSTGTTAYFPVTGVPKSAYNLIAMYEKGPINLRVAYTWTDETATKYYSTQAPDIAAAYGVLDLQIGYNIDERASVSFTAGNILGYRDRLISHGRATNIASNYQSGARYGLQLKYDLF